ncbi:hypothetical protein [Pararhizobium sp. O133]|uniref:hypothetical protein n=1 Tax=Pararhizobium sp. O133 TaxID=3449278 RepID=UPI003F686653
MTKPIKEVVSADDLAGEDFVFGLSSYSKLTVMSDCFRLVLSYGDIDMVDETVRGVVSRCADRAADIVETTPTDSFAWLVRAAASVRLAANEDFNIALQNSQLTGPNEQWIARFRVNLAENYFSALNPRSLKSEEADLRLLVSSEKGIKLIAKRYISNPDFRARITAVVETMPPRRQAVFLKVVKQAMNKG